MIGQITFRAMGSDWGVKGSEGAGMPYAGKCNGSGNGEFGLVNHLS